jgi:hypothetical protein
VSAATAFGKSSSGMVAVTALVASSITDTVLLEELP